MNRLWFRASKYLRNKPLFGLVFGISSFYVSYFNEACLSCHRNGSIDDEDTGI